MPEPKNKHANELLSSLDAKLAKKIERERAAVQPVQVVEPPARNVLEILDDAIQLMPASDAEFSVLERYLRGESKSRFFEARKSLLQIRGLLIEAD